MIIECIKCHKKFEVNSDLIPKEGRSIQCGSCDYIWFFEKNLGKQIKLKNELSYPETFLQEDSPDKIKKDIDKTEDQNIKNEKKNKTKKQKENHILSNVFSYLVVLVITLIAILIILDTFKERLYRFFPNLEFFLLSFFETLKDITLFIKDLI